MNKDLQVEIISPQGCLFSNFCYLISIPAARGEMGLMANHEAVLSSLSEGEIKIFDNQQNVIKNFPIKSGFAEMFNNKLLILVEE